jgi:hypothetical protein
LNAGVSALADEENNATAMKESPAAPSAAETMRWRARIRRE